VAVWVYMESGEWQKLSVYHLNTLRMGDADYVFNTVKLGTSASSP
jgi:hypothetical protein